nr:MAG TPA: hypothetical protein [Caudoviricetes sp.]
MKTELCAKKCGNVDKIPQFFSEIETFMKGISV